MTGGLIHKNGFTMVEILVVLALIGLLAGVLISRNQTSNTGIVSETAILKTYIRFVQSLAMADNTKTWGIKIESNQYTLLEDSAPSAFSLPDTSSSVRPIPPATNVSILSISPNDTISFDAWGSPGSQDYTIVLTDSANPNRTISVTKNTGFIP